MRGSGIWDQPNIVLSVVDPPTYMLNTDEEEKALLSITYFFFPNFMKSHYLCATFLLLLIDIVGPIITITLCV